MLKRTLLTAAGLFGLVAIFYFSTEQNEAPIDQTLFPGEWFYNERAYPNNYINRAAIQEAEAMVKGLKQQGRTSGGSWQLAGPLNTGGRITDIAIDPTNDNTFYAAAATGGIFKTTDRGENFTPIFDQQTKLSIGDIAIAPSDADVLYAGTGEANASVNTGAFFGDGIYRTDDAGATWQHAGLEDSQHIGRIVVDPNDADRVFVAAAGALYGYNPERGVYRTTDGGSNWEQVLHVTDSTAAIDIVMNPQNTDILLASMWERTRKPWIRDYGGETSAIHRSVDGGDTWVELGAANGLPAASTDRGRIGLAIAASNPDVVYARYTTNEITNTFDGLYRSDDGGLNWNLVALGDIDFIDSSFGWYFGNVRVNPQDPDQVYVLGQTLYRSGNGGDSWSEVNGMHVDHHAMEYSSQNNDVIVAGNDGGLYISENGGNSWEKFRNLPITQFYNIEVDELDPNGRYGGTQDNNTIRTTTAGLEDWSSIWGGDGFQVNVDRVDNNYIYVESQFGNLGRSTNGGNSFNSAMNGIDGGDRNNWNTPVELSRFDPAIAYYGTQRLYRSNRAELWEPISPDLTQGQHSSGSLSYGTLTAIAPSYLNDQVVYTGSDDGKVHVSFDGGDNWEDISDGLPNRYITQVAISPSDDLTAYVTLSGYHVQDYDPHIFKTTDGGQTWNSIAGNLPDIPVNDVVMDSQETTLIIATDLYIWYSQNDGDTWELLGDNLPNILTRDIRLHEPTNTLYAGTYGRSMYSYDMGQIILNTNDFDLRKPEIVLYPNPSDGLVNIEHRLEGTGSVRILDMQGRIVQHLYQGDLSAFIGEQQLFGIFPGVYFVQFQQGSTQQVAKLVIR
mgnify:CR=1 FL=1